MVSFCWVIHTIFANNQFVKFTPKIIFMKKEYLFEAILLNALLLLFNLPLQAQDPPCKDIPSLTISNISNDVVSFYWNYDGYLSDYQLQYLTCDEVQGDFGNGNLTAVNSIINCPADIWIEVPGPSKKANFEPCNIYNFRIMAVCLEDTIYSEPVHFYYNTKVCQSCNEDPTNNLDWLQQLTDQYANQSTIYELRTSCINGQLLFNLSAVDCCTGQGFVYDEVGNLLCEGSPTDLACGALQSISQSKLIWTNKNNLFEAYPWLNEVINESLCTSGAVINKYTFGIYAFLHIKYPNGKGDLYFQDGTYYCSDNENYTCLDLYNFGSPVASKICHNENTNPSNALFNTYNWLYNILNPNDCNAVISEYQYSQSHHFIFIETPASSKLYYQDGTLYCTNSTNYSCLDVYGFTEPVKSENCSNTVHKTLGSRLGTTTSFSVYPNPGKGFFNIDFLKNEVESLTLELLNMQGKALKQIKLSNNSTSHQLDLSNLAKGVYLITLQTESNIEMQKIILH